MNVKNLIAAVAVFAAAGSAMAEQTFPYVDFTGVQSTRTRAEVIAELKDAQANGSYAASNSEFVAPDANFKSTKTRAQVIAELKEAQADGSYALAHQEYDGQVSVQQARSHASGQRFAQGAKTTAGAY